MKLVLLDFDGVLNSHRYLYSPERPTDMEFLGNEHYMLDPVAIGRVNTILKVTGAKVVISSSWRHGWTMDRLREILLAAGFVGEVLDKTPTGPTGSCRGDEIDMWLQENGEGHDPFVILDDDSDMGHMAKYHVKTTFAEGILDEHVEEVVRRLMVK